MILFPHHISRLFSIQKNNTSLKSTKQDNQIQKTIPCLNQQNKNQQTQKTVQINPYPN